MQIIKFLLQITYFIIISVPVFLTVLFLIELKSAGSSFLVWFVRLVNKGIAFICSALFLFTYSIITL